jgi:ketosteroid isomerase-like protein
MSQAKVELVALTYDAWNRDDMDAMLATFRADFEFVTSGTFPGLDPVYAGDDGFRRFWHDFSETWDSILISVHEPRRVWRNDWRNSGWTRPPRFT